MMHLRPESIVFATMSLLYVTCGAKYGTAEITYYNRVPLRALKLAYLTLPTVKINRLSI